MKYNELIEKLDLKPENAIENKLSVLQAWCYQNISRDIVFSGNKAQSYEGYLSLVKYYLEDFLPRMPENLSESCKDFENYNAIQFIAKKGFDRLLFDLKPDKNFINQANTDTPLPLHLASANGHYYTLKTLCTLGADPRLMNKNQQPPIFSALFLPVHYEDNLKAKKIKIFNLLKKLAPETLLQVDNSGNSVLHLMASYGFSSLIENIFQTVPELFFIKNNHGHYPVHTAILNNQFECLRIFLTKPDVQPLADNSGKTALHYAAGYGSKAVISFCCNAADTIDPSDNEGITPLMFAADTPNIPAMEILKTHKANAGIRDKNGQTVLHHAVLSGSLATVSWVLNNLSVDLNIHDYNSQSALEICKIRRQNTIRDLLLKKGAEQ